MSDTQILDKFKQALRAVHLAERRRGFKAHLISYVAMNSLLAVINLLTGPERLWFLGSVAGWGLGVIVHYFTQVHPAEKQLLNSALFELRMRYLDAAK